MTAIEQNKTPVFVTGLPSQESINVARAIDQSPDLYLLPIAIGPYGHEGETVEINGRKIRQVVFMSEYLGPDYITLYHPGMEAQATKALSLCRLHFDLPELLDEVELAAVIPTAGGWKGSEDFDKLLRNNTSFVLVTSDLDILNDLQGKFQESQACVVTTANTDPEEILRGIRYLKEQIKAGTHSQVFSL